MAQHDMNIANQGFPAFRADLNNALGALVSNSSGATAPATTFAHQYWVDTSANPSILKIRNADNDAFITIGTINQTNDKFKLTPADGVSTDTISELTAAAGVTIDGVLLKDNAISATGPSVISVNSTSNALRITQVGTGNALLVEDSANPDATPFVIDASGNVIRGSTSPVTATYYASGDQITPNIQNQQSASSFAALSYSSSSAFAGTFIFGRSASNTVGTQSAVSDGTDLGAVSFQGSDGTNFIEGARILAEVDGTPGTNDMPGRLVFSTTADGASSPTERMRIDSAGGVGIGTAATTNRKLAVGGSATGATSYTMVLVAPTVQPDVTSANFNVTSQQSTASNSGTPYTITNLYCFNASQAAFNADSTVTNQYGYRAASALTGATNNYGFYSDIASGTGRWNFYADGTAANYFAGTIASLGSYTATTANAANMNIDSSGNIARSTSSIRYKKDVETLESQYADAFVAQSRPVWYRSKSGADNANWGWYGLIAEEVAEIDPRLVHWGYPMKTVEHEPAVEEKEAVFDEENNEVEPAVQAQEATYKEVPDTDAELQAEGVQYDRLTVLLLDVVKRQNESIKALEARVAALEAQ